MTQVSKYPVSKDVYERIFDIFLKTVSGLYSKNKAGGFLKEFLTPTEQIMLSKRLAISFLLSKNYKYREITRILRVSTNTIMRVSFLNKNGKYYKQTIDKIINDEKLEDFWLNVGEKLTKVLASGKSKSGSWRYLHAEIVKKRKNKRF